MEKMLNVLNTILNDKNTVITMFDSCRIDNSHYDTRIELHQIDDFIKINFYENINSNKKFEYFYYEKPDLLLKKIFEVFNNQRITSIENKTYFNIINDVLSLKNNNTNYNISYKEKKIEIRNKNKREVFLIKIKDIINNLEYNKKFKSSYFSQVKIDLFQRERFLFTYSISSYLINDYPLLKDKMFSQKLLSDDNSLFLKIKKKNKNKNFQNLINYIELLAETENKTHLSDKLRIKI